MVKRLLITTLVLSFVVAPSGALAHGGMMQFSETQTAPQMMRYVEDQALGNNDLHEEMENLMVQMMSGQLTQEQADRMVELVEQYPGVHSMMMGRLATADGSTGQHMMGWDNHMGPWGTNGAVGLFGWLVVLCTILWAVVGILLIVYLVKKLQK